MPNPNTKHLIWRILDLFYEMYPDYVREWIAENITLYVGIENR